MLSEFCMAGRVAAKKGMVKKKTSDPNASILSLWEIMSGPNGTRKPQMILDRTKEKRKQIDRTRNPGILREQKENAGDDVEAPNTKTA